MTVEEINTIIALKDEISGKIQEIQKRVALFREELAKIKTENESLDMSKSINSTINSLKNVAGLVSTAFAFNQVTAATSRVLNFTSNIDDMSKMVGISAEAMQELDYAAKQSGSSFSQVSTAITIMGRNLNTASGTTVEAVNALGLTVGQLKNMAPDEAFRAIAAGIAQIPDPMRQSQIAMELFGRSGARLLPVLKSDLAGLREEAHATGNVLSGEFVSAADQLGDKMTTLQGRLQNMKAQALLPLVEGFMALPGPMQTAMALASDMGPTITSMASAWLMLGSTITGSVIPYFTNLHAAFSMIGPAIKGQLIAAIVSLNTYFSVLAHTMMATVIPAFLAMMPYILAGGLIVAGIVAIYQAWKHWDEIVAFMGGAWNTVLEGLRKVPALIHAMLGPIGAAVTAWLHWDDIKRIVSGVATAVITSVKGIADAVKRWMVDALTGIADRVSDIFDNVVAVFKALPGRVVQAMREVYEGVKTWLVDRMRGIADRIVAPLEGIADKFRWLKDVVVGHSYVPEMVNDVISEFGRMASGMTGSTEGARKGVVDNVKGMSDAVKSETRSTRAEIFELLKLFDQLAASSILTMGLDPWKLTGAAPKPPVGPNLQPAPFGTKENMSALVGEGGLFERQIEMQKKAAEGAVGVADAVRLMGGSANMSKNALEDMAGRLHAARNAGVPFTAEMTTTLNQLDAALARIKDKSKSGENPVAEAMKALSGSEALVAARAYVTAVSNMGGVASLSTPALNSLHDVLQKALAVGGPAAEQYRAIATEVERLVRAAEEKDALKKLTEGLGVDVIRKAALEITAFRTVATGASQEVSTSMREGIYNAAISAMDAFALLGNKAPADILAMKPAVEEVYDEYLRLKALPELFLREADKTNAGFTSLSKGMAGQFEAGMDAGQRALQSAQEFQEEYARSRMSATERSISLAEHERKKLLEQWDILRVQVPAKYKQLVAQIDEQTRRAINRAKSGGLISVKEMEDNVAELKRQYEFAASSNEYTVNQIQGKWEAWYRADRDMRHAMTLDWTTKLKSLAGSFQQLAEISGESMSAVARQIGITVSAMGMAGKGVETLKEGIAQIGTKGGALDGLSKIATGAMGIASAFLAATNSGNKLMDTLSGAAMGAQIGAAWGGVGAAIGAGIGALGGFLRSLFGGPSQQELEGREAADKIRQGLLKGLSPSQMREVREAMAGAWKGNELGAAAMVALRDAYAKIGRSAEEASKDAQALWTAEKKGAKEVEKVMASINAKMRELSDMNEFLDQTMPDALSKVASSGALVTKEFASMVDALDEMGYATGAIDEFIGGQAKRAVEGINAAVDGLGIRSQASADVMSSAFGAAFNEMIARGTSVPKALEVLAPSIKNFGDALAESGYKGSLAFGEIQQLALIASSEIAGPMLQGVAGLGEALAGLHNSGLLTREMFTGLASEVQTAFDNLIEQGFDSNRIMRMMQPTLQRVWELMQDFGYEVDVATQDLIAQAEQAGIVGEAHRSSSEIATKAMQDAAVAMQALVDILIRVFMSAGDESEAFVDRARTAISKLPTEWHFDVIGNLIMPDLPKGMNVPPPPSPPPSESSAAVGGTVRQTGLALVHAGETIIPSVETGAHGEGGSEETVRAIQDLGYKMDRLLTVLPVAVRDAVMLGR